MRGTIFPSKSGHWSRLPGLVLLCSSVLCGQTEFEAASVKQGVPFPGRPTFYIMRGGGAGTPTPGEFTAVGAPLPSHCPFHILRLFPQAFREWMARCSGPVMAATGVRLPGLRPSESVFLIGLDISPC